ncbi:hypothetical protein H257_16610 [Aphanomyces astaci]|uniref:Glycoside hydrolase family 5 domain-containing protein n=2 Tax=Aphanomyces astaci TaxID=112090 RepID=W4FJX2_APHAT|nr:hypothetical protein H257_16610 [Aphanomyces astaci]ETV67033.1 hypothetical protein H257_16610 [Aphanomyces astaci]|eukprot:XP_009843402.1 hypothetical protein H257_16610 [Aphanomyces astaci]
MRVFAAVAASMMALAAAQTPEDKVKTFRKCRQSNYVTEGNQIFAVDPLNPTIKTPILIKGVQWKGMETTDGIPAGLWGKSVQRDSGINGTSLAYMLKFLSSNKFNTVRLPIMGDNFLNPSFLPKVGYIHGENREIALYDKGFTPKMADLLARFIGSFQKYRISVVLDLHALSNEFLQDAYWYYPVKETVEESTAYKVAVLLATYYCKPEYWNVLGIDLKDAMTDVDWPATAAASGDWPAAAETIAAKVNELCPQWLVFVTGGSKGSFVVKTNSYKVWPGLNFANATTRPLKKATNIVYSPQAFTQGVEPLGYFFNPSSNCSNAILPDKDTECVVIENGLKVPSTKRALACDNSKLQCQSFTPLSTPDLTALYSRLLDENIGGVVKQASVPVVFASFGGIYGSSQPLQSAVIDQLIKYIATSTAGGFFASLNPDTQMWLEGPPPGNKTIGRARYGLMTSSSWQVGHADLLAALAELKSTEIPCYGDEQPGDPDAATSGAIMGTSWLQSGGGGVAVVTAMLLLLV